MITHNLGYPRIGSNRELKKACENYWSGKITSEELIESGKAIRLKNWQLQKQSGLDLIPSNDFSFYDHILDMSVSVGAIPDRFICLKNYLRNEPLEFYFALARGYQKDGFDITAMEMTKWFDTNYHYIVPEFRTDHKFRLSSDKYLIEFLEAKKSGIITKPVFPGPVSYLMLGKTEDKDYNKLDLLSYLLPVYYEIFSGLAENGAEWIQLDEPMLAMNSNENIRQAFIWTYFEIRKIFPQLKIILATYFGGLNENSQFVVKLPVDALHIDLCRAPGEFKNIIDLVPEKLILSLGIVDGRNIWKNDFANSLIFIKAAAERIGEDRIMIAPSCSLIHTPNDLELENDEKTLPHEIKDWMAFSRQKLDEIVTLKRLAKINDIFDDPVFISNQLSISNRRKSKLIHNTRVKEKILNLNEIEKSGRSIFSMRKHKQQQKLNLPLFPATTIGSFPQTPEVRSWRARLKKGELSQDGYNQLIYSEIKKVIEWQEESGLDVLVHGEFERNDMVEYFGEMLDGYVFTKNGWIQSYGSRCVKPPVIFGDVQRTYPMTTVWIKYAQSLTERPVKGMLTGPVTMLQWSYVRDDQPRSETCFQIALAIRDEVLDLEKAGVSIIQIDEPALREGLPLKKADWKEYLNWAVRAFRITYAGVKDETQIHTHMCYSEFNDIIEHIAALDADVLTIECSRSKMELLDAFAKYKYPNDIGPGIYDIHSPRIPGNTEITELLRKAAHVFPEENIWVNPDCGLKTRNWEETRQAISNMVAASKKMREMHAILVK